MFFQVQLGVGDSADGVCELIEVFGLELEGVSDEGTILEGKQSLRKTGDFSAARGGCVLIVHIFYFLPLSVGEGVRHG